MFVFLRNTNRQMDLDEICHRGRPRGVKVLGRSFGTMPPTPWAWTHKGVLGASGASAVHFGKKLKQKLQGAPNLMFWIPNPDLEGLGASVLEPSSLTLK